MDATPHTMTTLAVLPGCLRWLLDALMTDGQPY
jgi:hypothetical protein